MQEQELVTTKDEEALFDAFRSEGLRSEERTQIRQSLIKRMDIAKPSLFHRMAFIWPAVHSKPAFGLVVFGAIALVGVGMGKASESALPGDVLYRAKTVVYEPVSEIFSQKDKKEEVKGSIRRRLDEAQALAIQGRLGLTERLQIEGLVEEDIQKIEDQDRESIRKEVVLMSKDYRQYFVIVLEDDKRIHIQMWSAPMDTAEKEALHTESDSAHDEDEDHENEDEIEERHPEVRKENSHESENEEDEDKEKQVKKSKSGSSNTSSSQSNEEDEEEEEEEEEESNSGSGSHSNDEDQEEEEEEDEEDDEEDI